MRRKYHSYRRRLSYSQLPNVTALGDIEREHVVVARDDASLTIPALPLFHHVPLVDEGALVTYHSQNGFGTHVGLYRASKDEGTADRCRIICLDQTELYHCDRLNAFHSEKQAGTCSPDIAGHRNNLSYYKLLMVRNWNDTAAIETIQGLINERMAIEMSDCLHDPDILTVSNHGLMIRDGQYVSNTECNQLFKPSLAARISLLIDWYPHF
jgi:hypothetical protein